MKDIWKDTRIRVFDTILFLEPRYAGGAHGSDMLFNIDKHISGVRIFLQGLPPIKHQGILADGPLMSHTST